MLAAGPTPAAAADDHNCSPEKVRELITLLQCNGPAADKAIACKQLAIYGGKEAVPALAPLLTDPDLTSWARIALEVIPGPEADAALRDALAKAQGRVLVGVINSIGVRRDPKAVSPLIKQFKASDPDVASAAAVALGRIGGSQASKALTRSLPAAPTAVRPAVAQGCILCAERFLADGKPKNAVKLYDTVRAANVPRQRQLEAIRGAILARKSAGLPLLLEQLRSPDKALVGIGLRTARELPGRDVTKALAAELRQCGPERQTFLLLAIADRSDEAVLPVVLDAASNGSRNLRLTAVGALDRLGNVSSVPVLLNAAADSDAELAQAALAALARMPGNQVDAGLLERFPTATGKSRAVLITVAGLRHIDRAVPAIFPYLQNSDSDVRSAAIQAIGILGSDAHAAQLVSILQESQNAKERENIEMALLAIIGRTGTKSVPALLPLAHNNDSALRITALRLLASAGGTEALAAVTAAVQDKDQTVQDEAVRTLSTWPNNWPDDSAVAEPLLTVAKSSAKTSHQVLALRGYLQYVQSNKQLKNEDKVSKVTEVLLLIKRPEEKRLAIAAIGTIPASGSIDMLVAFIEEPAVAEDACSAIVKLAGSPMPAVPQDQWQKALQVVADKSTKDATKKAATKLLKPS
ncbi:MAG: HEAT repeat domain-containing protein [Verrucomicrobia bacterium]|nr:HEAT repeat domain-containing protein [Verrucomicrobiota bacterium]